MDNCNDLPLSDPYARYFLCSLFIKVKLHYFKPRKVKVRTNTVGSGMKRRKEERRVGIIIIFWKGEEGRPQDTAAERFNPGWMCVYYGSPAFLSTLPVLNFPYSPTQAAITIETSNCRAGEKTIYTSTSCLLNSNPCWLFTSSGLWFTLECNTFPQIRIYSNDSQKKSLSFIGYK